jgi:hypothetical protein
MAPRPTRAIPGTSAHRANILLGGETAVTRLMAVGRLQDEALFKASGLFQVVAEIASRFRNLMGVP